MGPSQTPPRACPKGALAPGLISQPHMSQRAHDGSPPCPSPSQPVVIRGHIPAGRPSEGAEDKPATFRPLFRVGPSGEGRSRGRKGVITTGRPGVREPWELERDPSEEGTLLAGAGRGAAASLEAQMFALGARRCLVRSVGLSARGWRALRAGSQSAAVFTHLSVRPIKDKRIDGVPAMVQ